MTSEKNGNQRRPLNRLLIGTAILVVLMVMAAVAVWLPYSRATINSLVTTGVERAETSINGAGTGPDRSDPPHAENSDEQSKTETEKDQVAAIGGPADDGESSSGQHESEGEGAPDLGVENLKRLGIKVAVADDSPMVMDIERPAEVKFDNDRVVHVVPRVAGVVSSVSVSEGEVVEEDEVLAVVHSRELAEMKSAYLADLERRDLAWENFDRAKRLWEKKISSEKDYLAQKTALAEADIALTASQQKLRALGLSQSYLDKLKDGAVEDLAKYEIRAPITGTVIKKHISLGEAVSVDSDAFMVADTSTVWVDITVYPEDLREVGAGQIVQIQLDENDVVEGQIAFVTADVQEETRTAVARVIRDNAGGRLKPGMFVKAWIELSQETGGVRVPKTAVQNFNNNTVVFVQEGESFEPRPVKPGRENSKYVQVLSGLTKGESYVEEGAFTLKALIQKAQMGEGHGH
ncbi:MULTISPECIES: efflux RND transporter periplasmic adaptor subunit [Methyloceanibacter]|uniref:Cobalt/zinc/cadmium efflux RND transporter, membrane fusion protein, CzcB family n=1 Tax=Methyloceanibacter caenitepidi TaxID=1384459 RepID=A0A0A8K2G6_9HYPH|nr:MULTISPECIES: efflux RND transporter periplasmic adaptor subunit [Methyloceanibacter]BAQ16712.1 cobalt/zinc/cadmium efflux RND transporter, membrane fusion protein, CzcB family [Methyloceanibacter caenitepidi]